MQRLGYITGLYINAKRVRTEGLRGDLRGEPQCIQRRSIGRALHGRRKRVVQAATEETQGHLLGRGAAFLLVARLVCNIRT